MRSWPSQRLAKASRLPAADARPASKMGRCPLTHHSTCNEKRLACEGAADTKIKSRASRSRVA
eukprot:1452212-Pleurochrysis_carterae.AAC.1